MFAAKSRERTLFLNRARTRVVFREKVIASEIKINATVHTLRQSCATNFLEIAKDLRYIQEFLGHNNLETTQINTHTTKRGLDKIHSPLDFIELRGKIYLGISVYVLC